jgi:hypothetical protein
MYDLSTWASVPHAAPVMRRDALAHCEAFGVLIQVVSIQIVFIQI